MKTSLYLIIGVILLVSACMDEEATCSDGLMNQGEAGIDCGGPCSPCMNYTMSGESNKCLKMSEPMKSECLSEKAIREADEDACMEVENEWHSQNCILGVAVETGEPDLCDSLTDEYNKDACRKKIAVETRSPGLCKNLSRESEVETCLYRVGFDLQNITVCEMISTESSRVRCKAVVEDNYSICLQSSQPRARDYCLLKLSEANAYERVCEEIGSSNVSK